MNIFKNKNRDRIELMKHKSNKFSVGGTDNLFVDIKKILEHKNTIQ